MSSRDETNIEWDGKWCLAGREEWQSGFLRQKPDLSFELDLHGSLSEELLLKFSGGETAIIHGIGRNGDHLTVEAYAETKMRRSRFGAQKTYAVVNVIKGGHFPDLDPELYSLEFSLSRLHDWVNRNVFDLKHEFSDFPFGQSYQLTYCEPEPITLINDEDFSIHLIFWSGATHPSPRQREVTLSHFTSIRIDTVTPKKLSELMRLAGKVKAFLSFATSTPDSFTRLIGYRSKDDEMPLRKRVSARIECYPLGRHPESPEEPLFPHQMLFTLEDAFSCDAPVLSAWLGNWEKLRSAIQLYLGAMHSPEIYEEHRFLSLVQAVEGYHRIFGNNCILPKTQHKRRIAEILAVIPEEHKPHLRSALQHSNEPSLRERLTDLLSTVERITPGLITDQTEFVKQVVDTRNFLSHALTKTKRSARGEVLFYLSGRLATILEILILLRLGFEDDKMKEIINRSFYNRGRRGTIPFILE